MLIQAHFEKECRILKWCSFQIAANHVSTFFGKKHAQSNFSVLSLSFTAASVIASAVNYAFVSKGNFLASFICLTIISCIAAALSAVIREPK